MPRPSKKRDKHSPDHVIEVPLYGSTVSVFLRKHPTPETDALNGYEAFSFEGAVPNSYGVAFKANPSPGILAHEADHIATWICQSLGLQASPLDDEPHAYIVQFLTDAFHALTAAAG